MFSIWLVSFFTKLTSSNNLHCAVWWLKNNEVAIRPAAGHSLCRAICPAIHLRVRSMLDLRPVGVNV